MKCPFCGRFNESKVLNTSPDPTIGIRRRRECEHCENRFTTYERAVLATPQIIKRGGYREDFNREKVLTGLRTACTKRPVSAQDLEQLVDRVENLLRQVGQLEVESSFVGDLVIDELKKIDIIAYMRYALVYLNLNTLAEIRSELDKLIEEQQ